MTAPEPELGRDVDGPVPWGVLVWIWLAFGVTIGLLAVLTAAVTTARRRRRENGGRWSDGCADGRDGC